MTARDEIANLLWWSVPSANTPEAKAKAEQMLDAHRTEVLAKAVGRLRAIPVTCTALTGPVWYGDGWDSAITQLEEIAEYQTPDDEAFPGELERLRALALGLRVAAIRKNDLAEVQRLLAIYEETRKAATASASATPDFFQVGRTYSHSAWQFRCDAVTTHPDSGQRVALGWFRFSRDTWRDFCANEAQWADGWTEVTAAGEVSA